MIITDENILRKPCTDVLSNEVGLLIATLENELNQANKQNNRGIGLAAPQCSIHKKAAIVRLGDGLNVNLVNCKIAKGYDKTIFETEGCLSYPGRFERTMRYQEIHVIDNMVEPKKFVATGLFAVAIQHELDHLNGILLPDLALSKPILLDGKKIKPNDLCFCGKNLKYKKCHGKV